MQTTTDLQNAAEAAAIERIRKAFDDAVMGDNGRAPTQDALS